MLVYLAWPVIFVHIYIWLLCISPEGQPVHTAQTDADNANRQLVGSCQISVLPPSVSVGVSQSLFCSFCVCRIWELIWSNLVIVGSELDYYWKQERDMAEKISLLYV